MTRTHATNTILIVDDEPHNLDVLNNYLRESKFRVLVATDGEQALKRVNHSKPDLILLDVRLPGIDGFETCRRLKALKATRDVPVIFITVDSEPVNKVKGFEVGAVDYITKPFSPEEVVARIMRHLAFQRLQDELTAKNAQLEREIAERVQTEDALRQSERNLARAHAMANLGSYRCDLGKEQMIYSRELSRMLGFGDEEHTCELIEAGGIIHPDDLPTIMEAFQRAIESGDSVALDVRVILPDGRIRHVQNQFEAIYDDTGQPVQVFGTIQDISERKQAEEARTLHLRFLENIERINRVIQQATDVEQMMSDVLLTTREIFEADRAWLLYPCDPDAASWSVPMEHTRPEYPGAFVLGEEIPMLPEAARLFRRALDVDDVITIDTRDIHAPKETDKRFSTLSQLYLPIHPRTGKPWIMGLHQCSYHRDWTVEEQELFREIGSRIRDALSSLLFLRQLRESEANLRAFMENARGFGVYRIELADDQPYGVKIIFTSPSLRDILGIDYYKDTNWFEYIHLADRDRMAAAHYAAISTGREFNETFRLYHVEKQEWRWIRMISSAAMTQDGTFTHFNGLLVDVTEVKRAEKVIQVERDNFRNILESMDDGVYIVDRRYDIQYVNQVLRQDFGSYNEQKCYTYFHDRPSVCPWCQNQEALAGKTMHWESHAMKNGRTYDIISTPLEDSDGEVSILEIFRDITERKQAEDLLRKLSLAVEQSGSPIAITDIAATIEFVNPAFTRITGYTSEEAIGQNPRILQSGHTPPQVYQNLWDTLARGEVWQGEWQNKKKSGELYWEFAIISPVKNQAGETTHYVAIKEDITARKQTEQELQQAKEAAEAANRAKSTFLANMSHELRTPLNSILGYAQILKRDPAVTAQQRNGLNVVEQSGNHLLTLINDVLDLAKIEAGKLELSRSDFHLLFFLKNVSNLIRVRAEREALTFRMELSDTLPPYVHGDEQHLRQVLLNLLDNAVKFTDKGEVTLRVNRPTVDSRHSIIRFEVTDSGVGIAPDQLHAIFEPFQQVGDLTHQTGGTGLGLAISRRLIQLMGGELHVESIPGKKSTFWFAIFLPEVVNTGNIAVAKTRQIVGVEGEAPTLLVVDDNREGRRVFTNLLLPLGFNIIEACSGQEALTKAKEYHPAGVITDIVMSEMDGLELIRQIREVPELSAIVIIATSAKVYEKDQQECFAAGSNAFLPKPIQVDLLLEQLQRCFALEWLYKEKQPEHPLAQEYAGGEGRESPNSSQQPGSAYAQNHNCTSEVATLPSELLDAVEHAVVCTDITLMTDLIDGLHEEHPVLAEELAKLAYDFEYEAILQLIHRGKKQT